MKTAACIEDLRRIARERVPRVIFDYVESGSYTEGTLAANRRDLERLEFRQRVMVDVSKRSLACRILGEAASMPLVIAPTGLTGLVHADGELHGARAAKAAGIPFCLSTMSILAIEDLVAGGTAPFWFQLYVMRDRGFSKSLVERAAAAKCSALVLTVDLPILGQRHRDVHNGLTVPPRLTLANALDIATKPAWLAGVLLGKRKGFGNLQAGFPQVGMQSLMEWVTGQFDASVNWKDVEWMRSIWPGKLVIKGILDPEDAKRAAAVGAEAIVVSNHGGRQLDGAPSTISMLPAIADAVAGRTEIIFDSGIRTGADILRAIACGASSCMIGRAFLYGLGAGGEAGVRSALEILRKELDVALALAGRNDLASVDRTILNRKEGA